MIFSNAVLRAFRLADDAHYQQVRKYTGLAYITHPFRVALRAASLGMSEDCVVAAMLHDVVEDCGITLERIQAEFGVAVATLVSELTNTSKRLSGLNRAQRRLADHERISSISPEAKRLKLLDRADNLAEFSVMDDPQFADLYSRETTELLEVLMDVDHALWCEVRDAAGEMLRETRSLAAALSETPALRADN